MKALSCIFLLLALAMTAAAADITGNWSGTYAATGPDGTAGSPNPAYLVLKQNGATVSGTAGADAGEQFPLENVKFADGKLTAQVSPPDGAVYALSVTVDGDRMAGELTVTQGTQSIKGKIELKRVQ